MRKFFILILFMLYVLQSQAQIFKKSHNTYDEQGKRKGTWITYWDEEKHIPMSKARFLNGREVGVSKEYHINGNLRLKFRYNKNRMRVKYYNEDRKLEQKGWSVIEYNVEETHYYWHGKWKFYNGERKIERISYYENGEEVTTAGL